MVDPGQDDKPTDASAREEVAGTGGILDTDDTTEADQGMTGGTGAAPAEGATQPLGTDPLADEQEQGEDEGGSGGGPKAD